MKSIIPYTFFDQYCLRTPILSLNFYHAFVNQEKITPIQFKTLWENEIIREAIFLASPDLYRELDKWLATPDRISDKNDRLATTLLKYVTRMSSRCTPFGLFAGCSVGHFDSNTIIELAPDSQHERVTHFDMNFLVAFAQSLSKQEDIRDSLVWYPNTSIYQIAGQYRYVEYTYNEKNRRIHSIEAITHTPFLEKVITLAQKGAKVKTLANSLVSKEITYQDAIGFIELLIANQILVSELEPSVTGEDFLIQLQKKLSHRDSCKEILEEIKAYQSFLTKIDTKLGNTIKVYKRLQASLKESKRPFEHKFLFQTDLYVNTSSNQLHKSWAYKLKRALPFLNKITVDNSDSALTQFKNAFVKKYETQEVALPIALDTELGVGYLQYQDAKDSTPILDDLNIPLKRQKGNKIAWHPFHEILQQKLQALARESSKIVTLTDSDVATFQENWNDLPNTMSAITEIVALQEGPAMYLASLGGSSAANLLGRFSTGNSEIYKYTKAITDLEEQYDSDKILVEIVHLPESRTGNILRRAKLRTYELPYLAKSNLETHKQILINDLMISVVGDQIILRSKSLNKQVKPFLTNAHNYSTNALPIYQFLCDLQYQNLRTGLGFRWGEMLEKQPYLPRVVYKDFILSKARWKLDQEDFTTLKSYYDAQNFEELKQWRAIKNLPQYVQLIEGDNTLLVNFENENSVGMLVHATKRKAHMILEEFLFALDGKSITKEQIVKKGNEAFANQIIFSFFNEEKLRKQNSKTAEAHK
ncbi:lantibiotic dehydratase family protein [Aquimarina sp. W85]|uniref:lantibiotic dehydratase family protein n=1 Tax=Aquimarina rhodophyticola TaxID=3342246 RepID=UPI00366E06F1